MVFDRDKEKNELDPDLDVPTEPVESVEPRAGDVLGLGGAPVPKEETDPTAEHDPESVARRRARASGGT
jgi:hypothetical protein